jgi:hypothetical protein
MIRNIAIAALVLGFFATLSLADQKKTEDTMTATGTVKTVTDQALTVTKGAQSWDFVIDRETRVVRKGGTHDMAYSKEMHKPRTVSTIIKPDESVVVTYHEKDGKLLASEIRVM